MALASTRTFLHMDRALVGGALLLVAANAPAAEGTPLPTAHVHIEAPREVTLEARPDEARTWLFACLSPCDRALPTDRDYRMGGAGVRPSATLRLVPDESLVLTVHPVSQRARTAGIVLIVAGAVCLFAGDVLSDILLGYEVAHLIDKQPPPSFAHDLVAPGIVVASIGVAALATALPLLQLTEAPTGVTERVADTRWQRVAAWRTGPTGAPTAWVVPLLDAHF